MDVLRLNEEGAGSGDLLPAGSQPPWGALMEGDGILRAGRGGEVSVTSESNQGQCFPSTIFEKYIKCEQDRPKPAAPSVLGMPPTLTPIPSILLFINSSPSAFKHVHVSPMLKIHEIPCQLVSAPAPSSSLSPGWSNLEVAQLFPGPHLSPLLRLPPYGLCLLPAASQNCSSEKPEGSPQGLILRQPQAH